MKFIATLKIYITIFALIQLSFSSRLESASKNKVATESKNSVTSAAKAVSTAKTELKTTTNSASSLKTELKTASKTELKSKTEATSKSKTEAGAQLKAKNAAKSGASLNLNLKGKSSAASQRTGIIDMNNLFNPNFESNKKNSSAKEESEKSASSGSTADNSDSKKTPQRNTEQILSDWLMISSAAFHDKAKFPDIYIHQTGQYVKIHTDSMDFRINDAHEKDKEQGENVPTNGNCFWFRLSGLNIYYSSTVSDINILGSISIATVVGLINLENDHSGYYCFIIKDNSGVEWKICSLKIEKRNTWVCAIQATLGVKQEPFCHAGKKEDVKVIDHNIIQPYIVIPLPSRKCNEKWNYQQYGRDWECDCAEGKEQSPIDLPKKEDAIDTNIRPLFQYDRVDPVSKITTIDGQMQENRNIQLKLEDGALRIKHIKFGKVVTVDGAVYHAQEIVIHTPSEHKINGKLYDMEVQIVHYGQTKGDIAKQLTLSFLFEKRAGVYNKFLDDLDFFNLPSPINPKIDLVRDIFIPKILYETSSTEIPTMKPFSFYTYQGSITFPPCVEDTIVYVASKPLYIGTTALQLFTEALRIPDLMAQNGNVIVSDWIPVSRREIQPLNGRPVFHYDHEKYCGPDREIKPVEEGHYEKIQKAMTKYFYVSDEKPSGIPNAFVVSKEEALGLGNLKR